jgi:hypothetical protein
VFAVLVSVILIGLVVEFGLFPALVNATMRRLEMQS